MGDKEEPKIGNQQKTRKESKISEEKTKDFMTTSSYKEIYKLNLMNLILKKGAYPQDCFSEKEKMRIQQFILKKAKTGKIFLVQLLKRKRK